MSRALVPCLLAALALSSTGVTLSAAEPLRIAAANPPEAREWSVRIEALVRAGGLAPRQTRSDPLMPERQHVRYAQLHRGVPVIGGDLVMQTMGPDVVSVFGTLYDGIDVDTAPALSAGQAVEIASRLSGWPLAPRTPPELAVLPLASGGYALAYSVPVFTGGDRIVYAIEAHTGAVVEARSELETQSAVGRGTGVLGDAKKMSVRGAAGRFLGDDLLRPPRLETFDMQ